MDEGKTFFTFPSNQFLCLFMYTIMYIDIFFCKLVVRSVFDKGLGRYFTTKDIYSTEGSCVPLLRVRGKPKAVKMMNGFNECNA